MEIIENYVGGSPVSRRETGCAGSCDRELLGRVPLSGPRDVDRAVRAAHGVNIGVPAPVAYFPFTGWKDSFFGDLHATGRDGVEFYTERKVVIERWQ